MQLLNKKHCLLQLSRGMISEPCNDGGADPDAKDATGNTALMYALFKGRDTLAQVLIKHRADVNLSNNQSATPLMIAAVRGQEKVCELCSRKGRSPIRRMQLAKQH